MKNERSNYKTHEQKKKNKIEKEKKRKRDGEKQKDFYLSKWNQKHAWNFSTGISSYNANYWFSISVQLEPSQMGLYVGIVWFAYFKNIFSLFHFFFARWKKSIYSFPVTQKIWESTLNCGSMRKNTFVIGCLVFRMTTCLRYH